MNAENIIKCPEDVYVVYGSEFLNYIDKSRTDASAIAVESAEKTGFLIVLQKNIKGRYEYPSLGSIGDLNLGKMASYSFSDLGFIGKKANDILSVARELEYEDQSPFWESRGSITGVKDFLGNIF